MIFLYAFIVGGLIAAIAQLIQEFTNLSTAHMACLFVFLGAILEFFNIYDMLVEFSSAGALVHITSFGHSIAQAGYEGALKEGIIGIFKGIYSKTSSGILFAILLSFIASLFFKPKS